MAVETLRSLLQQVRRWPIHMLPTVQQAAMNLVRGIAAATPEEIVEGAGDRKPDEWWYRERDIMDWGTWPVLRATRPKDAPEGVKIPPSMMSRRCQTAATADVAYWQNTCTGEHDA